MRLLPLVAALLALLPATAHAATATIHDPARDASPSFEGSADLVRLGVVWDGTLTISATYAQPPGSARLDLLVSAESRADHDPTVTECARGGVDTLNVVGDGEVADLTVPGVEGSLRTEARWDGTTVIYAFRDATLDQLYGPGSRRDPFACASGFAYEDEFYGAFDGKVIKLTSASARAGLEAELTRRHGPAFAGATRRTVNCPRRAIQSAEYPLAETEVLAATALCAFRFQTGTRYRMGGAVVYLAWGVPRVVGLDSRTFPASLRYCGMNTLSGGWHEPPGFGAFVEAWGKRVSCRTARRVAMRWRGRSRVLGFRCRTAAREHEYLALRCTKRGGREVRIETGA